jgi:hypothetical protein
MIEHTCLEVVAAPAFPSKQGGFFEMDMGVYSTRFGRTSDLVAKDSQ